MIAMERTRLVFLFCYCIKQIDFILARVCSVTDHRRRQNVVRTSLTNSPAARWSLFGSYQVERLPFNCTGVEDRNEMEH